MRSRSLAAVVAAVALMAAVIGLQLRTPSHAVERSDVQRIAETPTPKPLQAMDSPTTPSPEPQPDPTLRPTPSLEPMVTDPPSPTPDCRDSFDPACGDFRWSPEPAENQAMRVEVVIEPAAPKVGEEVTFTTKIDDDGGSGHIVEGDIGDAMIPIDTGGPCNSCKKPYGPWTPPAQDDVSSVDTLRHTYANPGTYDIWIHVANYSYFNHGPQHPFGSEKTTRLTLTVAPSDAADE